MGLSLDYYFLVSSIIFTAVLLLSTTTALRDYWLTYKGVLPAVEQTTLDGIKRLRNEGKMSWAIKRFDSSLKTKINILCEGLRRLLRGFKLFC